MRRSRRGAKTLVMLTVIGAIAFGSAAVGSAKAKRQADLRGSVIADIPVKAAGVNGSAYLVKYWSRTVLYAPVMVTGVVYVPRGTPPAGGWPVVTYAHGTDGSANACAPSRSPSTDVPYINDLLDRGWEVTATDYQGEGNQSLAPTAVGVAPHGVNPAAEHDVIDIVRAATHLTAAHASKNYVALGYSEGGGASSFVMEYANWYAPDLHLKGAVAIAPPSDLADDFFGSPHDGASPFTLMYIAGYHQAYGNSVNLAQLLTAKGNSFANMLTTRCYNSMASAMNGWRNDELFRTTVLPASFRALLNNNDPQHLPGPGVAPLLIVQGTADSNDPAVDATYLGIHLCALRGRVVLWMYPGLDHNGIVGPSMGDITHWIGDRFAGQSSPDPYRPDGVNGITRGAC